MHKNECKLGELHLNCRIFPSGLFIHFSAWNSARVNKEDSQHTKPVSERIPLSERASWYICENWESSAKKYLNARGTPIGSSVRISSFSCTAASCKRVVTEPKKSRQSRLLALTCTQEGTFVGPGQVPVDSRADGIVILFLHAEHQCTRFCGRQIYMYLLGSEGRRVLQLPLPALL